MLKSTNKRSLTYRHQIKTCFLAITFLCTLLPCTANAGLKIYYIRHAEGGHNVTQTWKDKGVPRSEWPSYVGNKNAFTPKGKAEVAAVPDKLQHYKFDFIASSPLWRVRNTIAPYLRATNQKAEIWPELREGPGMLTILSKDIPDLDIPILNLGEPIELPEEETDVFALRSGAENNYKWWPRDSSEKEQVAYVKHVTLHAIQMIENRFGGSDSSILLAGHNSAGVSLLKLLIQDEPTEVARRGLNSTGMWMVEQQEDGSYELKMYNDQPYKQK